MWSGNIKKAQKNRINNVQKNNINKTRDNRNKIQEKVNKAQEKRTIIVNGYAEAGLTREQMALWADDLTYVSCYSYGFNQQGELIPFADEDLIRIAKDSGVVPLMVLTPFDETGEYSYELARAVFTDPTVRDRMINNMFLTILEKGYYGAVFNFGYIAAVDREEFVITVSKTAARLNAMGALVIVSLVQGLNDAGINYAALGRAANLMELRTFYWEEVNEPPAAVSPIDRVREMLSFVTASVDSRMILLGLSNYGLDWALPFIRGSSSAELVTHAEAQNRAEEMGAEVRYEEEVHAPYYIYTDSEGRQHEVWFENEESIGVKLDLVNEFNLAGLGIWTIMEPFPAGIQAINERFTVLKV